MKGLFGEYKMKGLFLVLLFVLALCIPVSADTVTASWEYLDPPADLVGFNIYKDGNLVAPVNDPASRETTFDCDLQGPPVEFTMTARDAVHESVHSEAYHVDPIPPAPTFLTVSTAQ